MSYSSFDRISCWRSVSVRGKETSGKKRETALQCCICPTCPSPAGGSLTHFQALALSKRARDVVGSAIAPPRFWSASRACAHKGLAGRAYAIGLRFIRRLAEDSLAIPFFHSNDDSAWVFQCWKNREIKDDILLLSYFISTNFVNRKENCIFALWYYKWS